MCNIAKIDNANGPQKLKPHVKLYVDKHQDNC